MGCDRNRVVNWEQGPGQRVREFRGRKSTAAGEARCAGALCRLRLSGTKSRT
jgi:hypothetical protein